MTFDERAARMDLVESALPTDSATASLDDVIATITAGAPSCFSPDRAAIRRGLDELVADGRAHCVNLGQPCWSLRTGCHECPGCTSYRPGEPGDCGIAFDDEGLPPCVCGHWREEHA